MLCPMMGNGIPITCTAIYRKRTGQPMLSAGSKNPTALAVWSVNLMPPTLIAFFRRLCYYDTVLLFIFLFTCRSNTARLRTGVIFMALVREQRG